MRTTAPDVAGVVVAEPGSDAWDASQIAEKRVRLITNEHRLRPRGLPIVARWADDSQVFLIDTVSPRSGTRDAGSYSTAGSPSAAALGTSPSAS